MTSSIGKMKSVSTAQQQSIFKDCLYQIKQLDQLRFLQKICSPIPKDNKQKLFHQYQTKFIKLHTLLEQIQTDFQQKNTKEKSFHKNTNEQTSINTVKQLTHKVQFAYKELFINGSFKYYVKVAVILGLPIKLHTINIDQWSYKILSAIVARNSWCC